MHLKLWEIFKNNVAVAQLFLFLGFASGVIAFKYVSDIFNVDVVLKGSYVFKNEIEKEYVPLERYRDLVQKIDALEQKNTNLKKLNSSLQEQVSQVSVSVCQRYASEADSIIEEQRQVEKDIQKLLSLYYSYDKKDESQLAADREKVGELRKYSDSLNQQLIQVREKISKCVR